mmetsp:Transcript_9459/g.25685  ORF Transcript_9459/g.25685 Transcript_9459/m.25685 type:complete len:216 (+) Transcript_9459:3995-4642(+)
MAQQQIFFRVDDVLSVDVEPLEGRGQVQAPGPRAEAGPQFHDLRWKRHGFFSVQDKTAATGTFVPRDAQRGDDVTPLGGRPVAVGHPQALLELVVEPPRANRQTTHHERPTKSLRCPGPTRRSLLQGRPTRQMLGERVLHEAFFLLFVVLHCPRGSNEPRRIGHEAVHAVVLIPAPARRGLVPEETQGSGDRRDDDRHKRAGSTVLVGLNARHAA